MIRWNNKNDIDKVLLTLDKKYSNVKIREDIDRVDTTEYVSEPLMIEQAISGYPSYVTGCIVHYVNKFTFKDGRTKTEDSYAYRFYEKDESISPEISFDSVITENMRFIPLFPDEETRNKLIAIIKGENYDEMEE